VSRGQQVASRHGKRLLVEEDDVILLNIIQGLYAPAELGACPAKSMSRHASRNIHDENDSLAARLESKERAAPGVQSLSREHLSPSARARSADPFVELIVPGFYGRLLTAL
jgi:hypothetical protein